MAKSPPFHYKQRGCRVCFVEGRMGRGPGQRQGRQLQQQQGIGSAENVDNFFHKKNIIKVLYFIANNLLVLGLLFKNR